jgi:methionyl-tRNA formyltransferase
MSDHKLAIAGKSFAAVDAMLYIADYFHLVRPDWRLIALPSQSDPRTANWQPSLQETAEKIGIPSFRDVATLLLAPEDVLLSVEYDQIIRSIDLGGARAYNVHFSALPAYRGSASGPLMIQAGETHSAVTLHVLTDEIDGGPVVAQRAFPIGEQMTSYSLYRAHNDTAYALIRDVLPKLLDDALDSHSQFGDVSTFRRGDFDYAASDIAAFDMSAVAVRDRVRALIFKPYQLPTFEGRKVVSADVLESGGEADEKPGLVVICDDVHAVVRCSDGYVRLLFDAET